MATLSMTQAKMARKRFKTHYHERTCGNCGLHLMEGDDVLFVELAVGSGSNYFHRTAEGCAGASNPPVIIPQGYKARLYLLDDLI